MIPILIALGFLAALSTDNGPQLLVGLLLVGGLMMGGRT